MLISWLLVAVIVVMNTVSDVLQSKGMRHHGEIHDFRPGAMARVLAAVFQNRYIIISVVAMAVAFFAFIALLARADLSFAVPATAASFVLDTICAKFLLQERVNWKRWVGASLVAGGVALLSL